MADLDIDAIQGSLGQIKKVPEEQFYDLAYLYEKSKQLWEIKNSPVRAFNAEPVHKQFKTLVQTGRTVVARFSNKYTLQAVDRDVMESINPPVLDRVLGDDGFFDPKKIFERLYEQDPMLFEYGAMSCKDEGSLNIALPQSVFFILTENPAGGNRISQQNTRQILLPVHLNDGEYLAYLSLIPNNRTPHGVNIFHNFPQTRCTMRDLVDLMIEYEAQHMDDKAEDEEW